MKRKRKIIRSNSFIYEWPKMETGFTKKERKYNFSLIAWAIAFSLIAWATSVWLLEQLNCLSNCIDSRRPQNKALRWWSSISLGVEIFLCFTLYVPGPGIKPGTSGSWVRRALVSASDSRARGRYPARPHTFVSPSADLKRAVVSYWRRYVHLVLVNRLGGPSLPRNSVFGLVLACQA